MTPIAANTFNCKSLAPRHSFGFLPVRRLIALFEPVEWQMRERSFIALRERSSCKYAYGLP
jgi:hypothetical protein